MEKQLTKSENRMLSGVCAGIAEYLGCDATLVRVVYALLSVCSAGFPGLLIYIILAILMPSKS